MSLIALLISGLFVNNFLLSRFLGLCPFFGVSKKTESALGMGIAATFVMVIASAVTYIIQQYILVPFDVVYLQTVMFILVIAGLVQFVELYLRKFQPDLYNMLGIYLPLITTNCAILGLALLNVTKGLNFIESVVHAVGAGGGFTLALMLMSGIRERLELAQVPKAFSGLPIAFITAAIMALAFMGFSGMI
ncbi:electron transport complex subunit RsxA [Candidatus Woesearchaeota archaeon CG11_big_fil_rev_8_21_14_0_20_43_8]|nr:MAG: electron transport complex subunit RsxA [Candidatus Woesearchaeota archaeon CG11_big_fil_rev_8_21_14_0_20_43_8]PIO04882.1 MAG: electron transport complex subunit RsxA [Candidatus Woesearchaeota archaeon CG08_land_8_20_14_0_20_43_7]